jgi:hypothetical protein
VSAAETPPGRRRYQKRARKNGGEKNGGAKKNGRDGRLIEVDLRESEKKWEKIERAVTLVML